MPSSRTTVGNGPRVALVGCGVVGDLHRERLLAEGAEIVAISDPDAEALSQMARRLPRRPKLFRSEQDLLAAGLAEAVVLCTPHGRHAAQIEVALEAGVHVLCEKPFVTHADQGQALVRRAREKNLALFVSFTRRSRGHARFLEASAGRIGPLRRIAVLRAQPWVKLHERSWRLREQEGGGLLLDVGASMLDLILRSVQHTVDLAEAYLARPAGIEVDSEASIRLAFLNGVQADLLLLGESTEEIEQIHFFGERGTAGWTLHQDRPGELYLRPTEGATQIADATLYRTLSPDAAFLAALRSGRRFDQESGLDLFDAATALPVVELVQRLYRDAQWR